MTKICNTQSAYWLRTFEFQGSPGGLDSIRLQVGPTLWAICIILMFAPGYASAQRPSELCLQQSQGPMEEHYCTLLGAGATLPKLADFRKNSPKVQRLLLLSAARKVGLDLDIKVADGPRSQSPNSTSPGQRSLSRDQEALPDTDENDARPSAERQSLRLSHLEGCVLNDSELLCGKISYRLQANKKNSQLNAEALSDGNQLILPPLPTSTNKHTSTHDYLSTAYPIYIDKMLEIGLGDSTMSFTNFAAIYEQNKVDELDFRERFRAMYNLLKIEKSRQHVQARYRQNYPDSIDACMELNEHIITCDNVQQNWIYRREQQ